MLSVCWRIMFVWVWCKVLSRLGTFAGAFSKEIWKVFECFHGIFNILTFWTSLLGWRQFLSSFKSWQLIFKVRQKIKSNSVKTHIRIVIQCIIIVTIIARGSVFIAPHSLGWWLSNVIISAGVQLWRHLRLMRLLLLLLVLLLLVLIRWLMCTRRLHQKHLLIWTRHMMIVGMIRWM